MSRPNCDPYHAGQQAIQTYVGERKAALRNGRNISPAIPAAARRFVSQQHYCLLGWRDGRNALWASFLAGPQGFARSDGEGRSLALTLSQDVPVLHRIPPFVALQPGDPIGVLFIELATRRRLSVKGSVGAFEGHCLQVSVERAFPLCPKYIQRRRLTDQGPERWDGGIDTGHALAPSLIDWIASADTCFVASAPSADAADVSHRGGQPGFVRVTRDRLTVPDYSGNSMFNTLGNFERNPRAGLAFVDFERNRQLQLSGSVELALDAGDADGATGGTGRWWHFHPEQWIVSPLNRAFTWFYIDASPFNP
jgi:hypothetical protein